MKVTARVLVVDDHVEFAESLRDLLEAKGYDTAAVYSGHDALERIKKEKFDIVLMDTRMPEMNGVTALQKIKKADNSIAVILMTGFSVDDVIKNAFKEGALAVLNKPLDIPGLFDHFMKIEDQGKGIK